MFRDPVRTAPLVSDVTDVELRLKVNRADSALFWSRISGCRTCASLKRAFPDDGGPPSAYSSRTHSVAPRASEFAKGGKQPPVKPARAAEKCLLAIELEPEAPRVNHFGHQRSMRDVEEDCMKAFVLSLAARLRRARDSLDSSSLWRVRRDPHRRFESRAR